MELVCEVSTTPGKGLDPAAIPAGPGVVLLETPGGRPYLARTVNLRRRALRLWRLAGGPEREVAIRYQRVGSAFESALVMWRLGHRLWPDDYRQRLRLRLPPLVKVHLANAFPRTSVTTRLTEARALFYGPFRSRAAAEKFESGMLDFFGVRRCVENLEPDPSHPGCIYGEIGKCLRPCQDAIPAAEYRGEAGRLSQALATSGASLAHEFERAREEASEALEFEEAAKAHQRLAQLDETLKIGEGLARDIDSLHGIVVQPSAEPHEISLWPLSQGFFQERIAVPLRLEDGRPQPLDRRLREAFEAAAFRRGAMAEREDHLAILARWRFSSWSAGKLVAVGGWDRIPYRRLVHAVSRTAMKSKRET